MAVTKPTDTFPDWANLNPTNPVSLQPAILEPSASKKDNGWDYKERPPRQDFNWLFNVCKAWFTWFETVCDAIYNNLQTVVNHASVTTTMEADSNTVKNTLDKAYLPRYFLEGFNYQSGSSDALNIYKGACVGTNGYMINALNDTSWLNFMAKRTSLTWARGTGVGGSVPSILPLVDGEWYFVWAIRLATADEIDFCFTDSTNPASAFAADPAVVSVRRIGSFKWWNSQSRPWEMKKLGKYFSFQENVFINNNPPTASGGSQVLIRCDVPDVNNLQVNMNFLCTYSVAPGSRVSLHINDGYTLPASAMIRKIAEMQSSDTVMRGEALVVPIITAGLGYVYYATGNPATGAGQAGVDPSQINVQSVGFFDPLDNEFDAVW